MKLRIVFVIGTIVLFIFSFTDLGSDNTTQPCKACSEKKCKKVAPSGKPESTLFDPMNRLIASI